jgi:hypothetical protein
MLSDTDAQVLALRQQIIIIETRLMALRQQASAAHQRIKICIEQLTDVLDEQARSRHGEDQREDLHQVILSLKHINDFILGEPTP